MRMYFTDNPGEGYMDESCQRDFGPDPETAKQHWPATKGLWEFEKEFLIHPSFNDHRGDNARFRRSKRNVPHVVVCFNNTTLSVCFFASTQTYKVFWPWPSNGQEQKKATAASPGKVVQFIVEHFS